MTWMVISFGNNEWIVLEEDSLTGGIAAFDWDVKFIHLGVETAGIVKQVSLTKSEAEKLMESLKANGDESDGEGKGRKRVSCLTNVH